MQFLNQLLQVFEQVLATIFTFIRIAWHWSVTQIQATPWDRLDDLPWWKVAVLVVAAGSVIYLLYRAARELLEAGEKALSAFVTLLTVFVRTLPPVLLAGAVATASAWIVNHLNF